MSRQQRDNIGKLIRKVSERAATEDLIAFVASNFGMLTTCREIIDILSSSDSAENKWLQEQCHNFHISSRYLQAEIKQVFSIFQPGFSDDEEYELLGLTSEAAIDEVKSAFRKLSFRYHPDSATSENPDDTQRFIAICRAYKKIMSAHEVQISTLNGSEEIPWRHNRELQPPGKQKRKSVFLIAAFVIIVLLFISFSVTRSYRRKAMLKSLGRTSKIAIVKQPEKKTRPIKTETPEVEEKTRPIKAETPEAEEPAKSASLPASTKPAARSQRPQRLETAGVNNIPQTENGKVSRAAETIKPAAEPTASKKAAPATPKSIEKPIIKTAETVLPPVPPATGKHSPAISEVPKPEKKTRPIKTETPEAEEKTRPIKTETPAAEEPAKSTSLPALTKPATRSQRPQRVETASANNTPQTENGKVSRAVSPGRNVRSLRSRIVTFLASYTNAYELMDIATFATFFTADAEENNIPFKEKLPKYRKLFAALKEISYKVTPRSWHTYNDLIYFSGSFHAYFLYTDGEEVNIHGDTTFMLSEDHEHHLKVKKLTYTIKE